MRHVSIEALASLIRRQRPCVVLTGAGISTESGIPDFRSPSGVWSSFDPMEVATIDAFRRDPERVWEFYALRLRVLDEAEPNDGHRALARLERDGWVDALITQNVDGLHARAGSSHVVEVHGSARRAVCPRCGTEESAEGVRVALQRSPLPLCSACGAVLKPGVVMFGELLAADAMSRAEKLAREAALMLVVGSTLEVWPVAGLPLLAGSIAIVNQGPTALDDRAELRIEGKAGETLTELVRVLGTDRAQLAD